MKPKKIEHYIIAVDFDGTLCENNWPEIGEANHDIFTYLLKMKEERKNVKFILWTCRTGELLENAVWWCKDRGLYFDAVNENLESTIAIMGSDSRKIFANEYIDDRNVELFRFMRLGNPDVPFGIVIERDRARQRAHNRDILKRYKRLFGGTKSDEE